MNKFVFNIILASNTLFMALKLICKYFTELMCFENYFIYILCIDRWIDR